MTEKTEKPDSNDVVNTATEQQEQGFDIEMSAAKTEFMKDVKLLVAENTASQRAFLSSAIVEHAGGIDDPENKQFLGQVIKLLVSTDDPKVIGKLSAMFDMHEANNAETDDFNLYTDAAEQSIKDDGLKDIMAAGGLAMGAYQFGKYSEKLVPIIEQVTASIEKALKPIIDMFDTIFGDDTSAENVAENTNLPAGYKEAADALVGKGYLTDDQLKKGVLPTDFDAKPNQYLTVGEAQQPWTKDKESKLAAAVGKQDTIAINTILEQDFGMPLEQRIAYIFGMSNPQASLKTVSIGAKYPTGPNSNVNAFPGWAGRSVGSTNKYTAFSHFGPGAKLFGMQSDALSISESYAGLTTSEKVSELIFGSATKIDAAGQESLKTVYQTIASTIGVSEPIAAVEETTPAEGEGEVTG